MEKPKYKKFQVMQLRINREGEGGLSRQGAYELSSPEKGGGGIIILEGGGLFERGA